ncbi:uncharacterized protein [Watersipora subatra]|uniref:uncharacterized protein n=1 Tax=Watersipora subatra TaxID=2589382 RepID=UPI00355C4E0E
MQPCKKAKIDQSLSSDPFADEDDWDNDDSILQLVADEVPTGSQISQVLKSNLLPSAQSCDISNANKSSKSRSFVFKRPTTASSSLLSAKPASYTSNNMSSGVLDLMSANDIQSKSPNSLVDSPGLVLTEVTDNSKRVRIPDLIRKQHAHEGEIQWLRTALKQKDELVNTIRTNYNAEKAKQRLQHSEKERQFVKDMETLRLELQFKESELMAVSQAMDRLKRDTSKISRPAMKLDSDGFPTSYQSSHSYLLTNVKSEPTATSSNARTAPKCDLRPLESDRLIPRPLHPNRHKMGLIINERLSCLGDRPVCKELADAIACARDLSYM